MNDRSILKGLLTVLTIIAGAFFWWLTWLILNKIEATDFMYLLFAIYVIFGFIVTILKDKIFDFDSRLKKLEEKVR